MTRYYFSLIPFFAPTIPNVTVTGNLARQGNLLSLYYSLAGNILDIFLPPPSAHPGRRDELWKSTCFEFFIGLKDQPQYWEFNMSPSGDWNIYHMDAYRRVGFREETSIQQLRFEVHNESDALTLNTIIDLSSIVQQTESLEVGITAVLQTRDSNDTYWALAHPGPQADFHLRESFILLLAGQTHPSPRPAPGS